jgi:hypothetical protein
MAGKSAHSKQMAEYRKNDGGSMARDEHDIIGRKFDDLDMIVKIEEGGVTIQPFADDEEFHWNEKPKQTAARLREIADWLDSI